MITLGIDSSSGAGSAAVLKDGVLLAEQYRNVGLTHSETLAPMVRDTLRSAGVDFSELGLVAVSCGPGSFTGIRIGVALAKGLAFPGGIPCAGVMTTEALARPFKDQPLPVAAVIDARRGRVFCGIYTGGVLGAEISVLPVEELTVRIAALGGRALVVGDGAEMCYNQLKGQLDLTLAPPMLREVRASSVAELGEAIQRSGGAVDAAALRPVYIQLSQAERTLKEKQKD